MKLKIQLQHHNARPPVYSTPGAACFDLYAATVSRMETIGDVPYPGHPVICDTGIAFEVPPGYMLKIEPRSGLKFNHGIEAFSGTIDSDYRGSVQVILNADPDEYEAPPLRINPGDRIAQACLIEVPRITFEVVEQLTLTDRGDGGLGSTGM